MIYWFKKNAWPRLYSIFFQPKAQQKTCDKSQKTFKLTFGIVKMKVKASVKADPSKGDKIVRRSGRLYVINKKDPNRKQRQKGPARKK